MEDSSKKTTQAFEEAQRTLEKGDLEQAKLLFESLDYENLEEIEPDDALAARVLALQLCILQERYADALYHADAALDLAEHEPLVHHLAGLLSFYLFLFDYSLPCGGFMLSHE